MDCIRGLFPYINVPFISNTTISDVLSGCIACQPFGIVNRHSSVEEIKPSREVKTISSLVDKLSMTYDQKIVHHPTVHQPNVRSNSSFYQHRPCSRQKSFSQDMNHEKFTPCEKLRFSTNDSRQNSTDKLIITGDYGKIKHIAKENMNSNLEKGLYEKSMVAPPRRKKRPAPSRLSAGVIRRAHSKDSNLDREIENNYRNLQLNNLDQPGVFKTKRNSEATDKENNNNNNFNENANGNKKKQNYCSSTATSQLINNNNTMTKLNNKSGCSNNLALVRDSLESNGLHFINLNSVSHETNTLIDDSSNNLAGAADYCENKIYYKNSGLDRFGNYQHGTNDTDDDDDDEEILVCESIVKFERKDQMRPPRPPPPHQHQVQQPCPNPPPKDATYTKFYTDKYFYQDHSEVISNRSFDEPFEQIVQLQPDMAPFFQNAFALLKAKSKQPPPPSPCKKQNCNEQLGNEQSNKILDQIQDSSIPVVFCGLVPIHQLNGDKWLQSVRAFEEMPENARMQVYNSSNSDDSNKNNNSRVVVNNNENRSFYRTDSMRRGSNQQFEKDVQIVVGCSTGKKSSKSNSIDENYSEFDEPTSNNRRTEIIDCSHYAEMDRCEM